MYANLYFHPWHPAFCRKSSRKLDLCFRITKVVSFYRVEWTSPVFVDSSESFSILNRAVVDVSDIYQSILESFATSLGFLWSPGYVRCHHLTGIRISGCHLLIAIIVSGFHVVGLNKLLRDCHLPLFSSRLGESPNVSWYYTRLASADSDASVTSIFHTATRWVPINYPDLHAAELNRLLRKRGYQLFSVHKINTLTEVSQNLRLLVLLVVVSSHDRWQSFSWCTTQLMEVHAAFFITWSRTASVPLERYDEFHTRCASP